MGRKQTLANMRHDLHKWVLQYVQDSCDSCEILRQPSNDYYLKSKIIGCVDDLDAAIAIQKAIEDEIRQTLSSMAAIASGMEVYPINYRVRVIQPMDDITISTYPAQRRHARLGEDIRQEIDLYIEYLKGRDVPTANEIAIANDLKAALSPQERYTVATDSGTSYRVSYYTAADGKRVQHNVGDVLLVVGTGVQLRQAPKRKLRADKAVQLGTYLYSPVLGVDMVLKRVYECDRRYIKQNRR